MSEQETKNLILARVIAIIGKEGVQGITARRIASETGVNVAAINYHFGSKEKLIQQGLQQFGKSTSEIFNLLTDKETPPQARLKSFLTAFTEHMSQYPGIVKSQMYQIFGEGNTSHPAFNKMIAGRKQLFSVLKEIWPEKNEATLNMVLFQIMSVVVYPALFSGLIEQIYAFDYGDIEERKKYLNLLFERYFS